VFFRGWFPTAVTVGYENVSFPEPKPRVPELEREKSAGTLKSGSCCVAKLVNGFIIQWPFQEPIHWRYLPYIRPIFQGLISGDIPPKIWPNIWY